MSSRTSPSCLLFLIGMPAAGKTFWGKKVAEKSGMKFADLDDFIVEAEKLSIPEIFEQYGEAGFRDREVKYLQQLIVDTHCDAAVVACGGGTPCYKDNLQQMKNMGTVIYLRAGISLLLSNLRHGVALRPLLREKADLNSYLHDLLAIRKNIYEQADYIVDAENLTLATFDKIIASCTNRH